MYAFIFQASFFTKIYKIMSVSYKRKVLSFNIWVAREWAKDLATKKLFPPQNILVTGKEWGKTFHANYTFEIEMTSRVHTVHGLHAAEVIIKSQHSTKKRKN
ncbi:hypothetical protein ACJX0J_035935 [Zea mays]